MAGRHRRPPVVVRAWRRFLLRLRRTDRAASLAALQTEVSVLRATVTELRGELAAARAAAAEQAEAHAMALTAALTDTSAPGRLSWLSMELPLVALAESGADGGDAGADLADTGEMPLLADLPEAALLDPKHDRIDLRDEPSVQLPEEKQRLVS